MCVCVGLKLGLKLEKIESFKSTSCNEVNEKGLMHLWGNEDLSKFICYIAIHSLQKMMD